MHKFINGLWERIPPGVAIAMLTIPAFVIPFIWESLTPLKKGIGISAVVLLVALEISVIYRERAAQNRVLADQIARLDHLRSFQESYLIALERVKTTVNTDGLRSRAMQLSQSIVEFAYKRLEKQPVAMFVYKDSLMRARMMAEYQRETKMEYLDRFGDRVRNIYKEIQDAGSKDTQLVDILKSADSLDDGIIQYIGDTLGELAEQLRD